MAGQVLNRVEGVREFTAACDKVMYGGADKVVRQSMTDAAKAAVKSFKGHVPKKMFTSLVKYRFKQGKAVKFMNVGFFERGKTLPDMGYPNTRGNNKTAYMIAYWLNYGTLNRRDRSHRFREPIKRKSVKSRRGVHPQKFFEKMQPAADQAYKEIFVKALQTRAKTFFENAKQNS